MRERWQHEPTPQARPAVYAIYSDDGLLYVGSTVSLKRRLMGHRKRFGRDVLIKASYDAVPASRQQREERLISRLRPRFNKSLHAALYENTVTIDGTEIRIRLPKTVVKTLKAEAAKNVRFLNGEIVARLQESLKK